MPMVLLEALSSGVPVVARDIPEFREVFGRAALLFSDIEGAAAHLKDEPGIRRIRTIARPFTERYDIRKIAEEHIATYRRLVNEA